MKKKNSIIKSIFTIPFISFIILIYIFYGIPLVGLPNEDNILSTTVINNITNQTVVINNTKKIKDTRKMANLLNFGLGKVKKEPPKFTIVYELKNNKKVNISANEETVYFKDRAYKIKGDYGEFFVNIVEGIFFDS